MHRVTKSRTHLKQLSIASVDVHVLEGITREIQINPVSLLIVVFILEGWFLNNSSDLSHKIFC